MTYNAKILCDSISPSGIRLTTMAVTMPRFILAEFNTHRALSRNSASSRAIPIEKRIKEVLENPFVPEEFGSNKKGMQAGEPLDAEKQNAAKQIWLEAARNAVNSALKMHELGSHKQWNGRLLEPYLWTTVIVSATDWDNFFNLRIHPDAQPEIKKIATLMKEAMNSSVPHKLFPGEWHTPFIDERDIEDACKNPSCVVDEIFLAKLATARCARVSYNTHDTGKRDVEADLKLHDRLVESGHFSPLEHIAFLDPELSDLEQYRSAYCGNFKTPWKQYRKMIPGEKVFKNKENEK